MKKIAVLYPFGDIGHPSTGGQVYDNRLFNVIKEAGYELHIIDDNELGRKKGESILKLPLRILARLRTFSKSKVLIFNTSLFPYYILPFFFFKLLFPRLNLLGIHHHFRFQEQVGWRRKFYKFLEFVHLKQCTYVINPCPYTRDVLLKYWSKGRVVELENSFDISTREISSYQPFKLLYVGSVYERKGIIYLLEALSMLSEDKRNKIVLDVVGGMDEQSEYVKGLRQFVDEKKLANIVNFRGRVSDEELELYYKNAYVFVFPSLLEGYGLVIIEAMSYGLPVIAFNNSAMPYSIKHGENGLLAQNKNSQSLSECIIELIDNPGLHRKIAKIAKQYSEHVYSYAQFKYDAIKFLHFID